MYSVTVSVMFATVMVTTGHPEDVVEVKLVVLKSVVVDSVVVISEVVMEASTVVDIVVL